MRLPGGDKIIVGYDLSETMAQISYCFTGGGEVETLSSVAGTQAYQIPAVLCKREGVNQWFYGNEALRYAKEGQGILITNLLKLAVDGEPLQVDNTTLDPVALLTLFLKRSLGQLSQVSSVDRMGALMITCENLDHRLLEVLNQAVAGLRLKTDKVCFQSHKESFYYYMIYQPEELWRFDTLLCEYQGNTIHAYRMVCNKRTTPIVAFMEERQLPFLSYEPLPEAESLRKEKLERMDSAFLEITQELCQNHVVSSVYLIGEDFSEEWMKESLRYLCKGRRVFQGNNLYSKGACLGMLERLSASEIGKSHVFLGNDKLKSNIGMKILRRGQESYYALLDAGINWFEAETEMEFYLQEGNRVELTITSLTGKGGRIVQMVLEELPEGISRLRMHLFLKDENHLVAELEDLGFGEFRKATHHIWKEEIEV